MIVKTITNLEFKGEASMKKWNAPEMEVLELNETANGKAPNDAFDDVWVQIDGLWYRPGNDSESSVTV